MFQLLPQKLQLFEEEKILPTDEEHLERTSPEIRPQPATELGCCLGLVGLGRYSPLRIPRCGTLQASPSPCTRFLGPAFYHLFCTLFLGPTF